MPSEIDPRAAHAETVCQSCKQPVVLELVSPAGARAWRMFNCPHCLKTNFVALPAAVVRARPASRES